MRYHDGRKPDGQPPRPLIIEVIPTRSNHVSSLSECWEYYLLSILLALADQLQCRRTTLGRSLLSTRGLLVVVLGGSLAEGIR